MSAPKADAVVMAGGFGTRLRPLTATLPKPMVPVANRPMMEHVINLLRKHGFLNIIVLLYFQPESISDYFGDGSDFGVNITYLLPEGDFGTAGSVRLALDNLADRFLIISADVLTDFNLREAFEFHQQKKSDATIVLTRQENPLPYGVVIIEKDGRINRFLEKPSWGEVFSDTVNSGVYVLSKSLMAELEENRFVDFGRELYPKWLAEGRKLHGFVADGYWRDIGNVNEYTQAHRDILNRRVMIALPDTETRQEDGLEFYAGSDCRVDTSAQLSGKVILGDGVRIGPEAQVTDTIIGSYSDIQANAIVRDSVVWSEVEIGPSSDISEAIICDRCRIGERVTILPQAILSEDVQVGRSVVIKANIKVWPKKEVESGAIVSASVVWGDKWNRELFTDAKVSGLANLEITPEFAARLGAAFGSIFPQGSSVFVSRDATETAHITARGLMTGLSSSGIQVMDLRTLPIPVVRYSLRMGNESGGVYVRRSPVNVEHQDIIFFAANGIDLATGKARSVERAFFQENFRRARPADVGTMNYPQRPWDRYHQEFLNSLNRDALHQARLRVVIDFAHGSGANVFPALLGSLECEVVSINSSTDPDRSAETQQHIPEVLENLSRIVTALHYDLGIFIDPGAEKMTVIDETGHIFSTPELLLATTELFAMVYKPSHIAVPVNATIGLDRMAEDHDFTVQRVRDDHLAMMIAAESPEIDFVGGTRGGFIYPDFQRGADAAYAAARLLEMLASSNTRLSERRHTYRPGEMSSLDIPCAWNRKGRVMRRLIEHTAGMTRDTVDGVRIDLGDRWIMIAPNRVHASFYLLAEAPTKAEAAALVESYRTQVLQWRDMPDGVTSTTAT